MSYKGANVDVLTDDPAKVIEQLNRLSDNGGKLIRWGFANDAKAISHWSIAQYREWLENRLWVFEQCYETLYRNQQPVILTFGHPVGGFDGRRWRIWYEPELMQAHFDNILLVAERYKGNATAFALAPFNEPSPKKQSQLNSVYRSIVTLIRNKGWQKHIVISHQTDDCDYMSDVEFLGSDAFLYEFHYYKPRQVLDPNGRQVSFSQAQVIDNIRRVLKWRDKHAAAEILVGEFGCRRESGRGMNQAPFINSCFPVWNQHKFSWCLHSESYDPNMVFKIKDSQLSYIFR